LANIQMEMAAAVRKMNVQLPPRAVTR